MIGQFNQNITLFTLVGGSVIGILEQFKYLSAFIVSRDRLLPTKRCDQLLRLS